MGADRDAGPRQDLDLVCDLLAALDLDGLATAFLHQPARVLKGLGRRDLIGQERHVRNDERVAGPAAGRPGVVDHVGHGHGNCGFVAEHHHAQGIAHQDDVHPGLLGKFGRRVVVGREHGDPFADLLHPQEAVQGFHQVSPLVFMISFSGPTSTTTGSWPGISPGESCT